MKWTSKLPFLKWHETNKIQNLPSASGKHLVLLLTASSLSCSRRASPALHAQLVVPLLVIFWHLLSVSTAAEEVWGKKNRGNRRKTAATYQCSPIFAGSLSSLFVPAITSCHVVARAPTGQRNKQPEQIPGKTYKDSKAHVRRLTWFLKTSLQMDKGIKQIISPGRWAWTLEFRRLVAGEEEVIFFSPSTDLQKL